MIALVFAVIAYCRAFFIGRHRLGMEVAALRHQLVVFKRKQPRPRLCIGDRAFWMALRRLWPGWVNALIIVKPDTVVSWHRAGFRLFWRLRSGPRRLGRPKVSPEVRQLIRRMKSDNPSWYAPRIHGELLQLGFDVSQPTVSRYLQRLRHQPDNAKAQRWRAFVQNHREVMVAFDFLYCAHAEFPGAVLLLPHRARPAPHSPLQHDRAPDKRMGCAAAPRGAAALMPIS